jgi:chorismate mutase/prephenate dehydratase
MAPKAPNGKIPLLRGQIDELDTEILKLLEQRAGLASEIGDEKRKTTGKQAAKFYDPEREAEVISRLEKKSSGKFPRGAIHFVYREVMSACRSLEAASSVAYLGPSGTFSEIAVFQAFGHSASLVECATIEGVFDAVSRGQAEYGVVPFENSCEGGVLQTLDALLRNDLKIRRELFVRVNHCLLTKEKSLESIRKVYSHPQALAQCRGWLKLHVPKATVTACDSTALAAGKATKEKGSAAIASKVASELFHLKCLREGLQDRQDNATRFIILSSTDAPLTGTDRTSIAISPQSCLPQALKALTDAELTVIRAESRASQEKMWQQTYFIDFKGHRSEARVEAVLKRLQSVCETFHVLGSYPAENPR